MMKSNQLLALAKQYKTPLYVYSESTILENFHAYQQGLGDYPHQICYSVKANSNLTILNLLADAGSGFDIVSIGELKRVIAAGGDPQKVVYSGVGKSRADLRYALGKNIGCFNIESIAEVEMLNEVATELQKTATVSLRINPNVDPKTHPYISTGLRENKFGIAMSDALAIYDKMAKMLMLKIVGVGFHIGSQLTEMKPYEEALDLTLVLVDQLTECGINLKHIDIGGGLGIRYEDETLIDPAKWIAMAIEKIGERQLTLYIEPGRSIVGNAGVLLTQVILTKENEGKHFAVVDAAMNDLIRPALYDAWMNISNLCESDEQVKQYYDIVGPICETGDFLGKNREIALKTNDILAVTEAGAYGFAMASNYNTRGRPAEVLIKKSGCTKLIRPRETAESLFSSEFDQLKLR